MEDLFLAKKDLEPGWISADVGEPHIVRSNLFDLFDIKSLHPQIKDFNQFEYTKPAGYDPLVKLLENKYQAPVIVSNGAKQSIGSLFYALKKQNKDRIFMNKPWWSLFPPLIKIHGLEQTNQAWGGFGGARRKDFGQLIVYPNNPAGGHEGLLDEDNLAFCREEGIPTIHDAAYFNNIYLPIVPKVGKADVQVFTCSKLLGLSQLRVGFAVYNNTQLYNDALSYMEHMTVGVSIFSQMFALNILKEMDRRADEAFNFEIECYSELLKNREHMKRVPSTILERNDDNVGMFLWTKCNDLDAFKKHKINVVEGTSFGMPGHIRFNLALPEKTIIEVVDRLNQ